MEASSDTYISPTASPEKWSDPKKRGWGFMLGRFQPFHEGHQALFGKILERHPAGVLIAVRDTPRDDRNPFSFPQVESYIYNALIRAGYSFSNFSVISVPDIQGVYYGRDVGYKVEQIELP